MLTIKEAAAYFNIGIKKLRRIAEKATFESGRTGAGKGDTQPDMMERPESG